VFWCGVLPNDVLVWKRQSPQYNWYLDTGRSRESQSPGIKFWNEPPTKTTCMKHSKYVLVDFITRCYWFRNASSESVILEQHSSISCIYLCHIKLYELFCNFICVINMSQSQHLSQLYTFKTLVSFLFITKRGKRRPCPPTWHPCSPTWSGLLPILAMNKVMLRQEEVMKSWLESVYKLMSLTCGQVICLSFLGGPQRSTKTTVANCNNFLR